MSNYTIQGTSPRALARRIAPLLLIVASPALAGQAVDQRLPASAHGSVEVSNVAGTVTVRGTTQNEVHVWGKISAKARLEFSVDGDHTIVKVVLPKVSMHESGSDLDIEIPAASNLTVSTVSADTGVTNVLGALDLQSVSGDIKTEAFDKDLKLRTVSGDVGVRGHRGSAALSVVTVSGNLDARDTGAEANATSVSGDLNLRLASVTRSRLRTTSGDITMSTQLASGGSIDSESVSGDISLRLSGARDAEYDLATSTGDISNCFGPEPVSHRYGPGAELKFREGAGSANLSAKTLSGDISLCKD
jgi:DUF4097 and DUF4098 domain-containing protein YvlB